MRHNMYTDKYLGHTITHEDTATVSAASNIVFLLPILSQVNPNIKVPNNHPSQKREEATFCRKLFLHTSSNCKLNKIQASISVHTASAAPGIRLTSFWKGAYFFCLFSYF